MRIAHFLLGRCNPDSANGVDKTIYHLAKTQAALGATVSVFSVTEKQPVAIPGAEVVTISPSTFVRLPRLGTKIPWTGVEPKRRLSEWKPDIVHFHSVHIGPFVGLARWLRTRKIPYVVTPHGGYALGRLEKAGWKVKWYIHAVEKHYLQQAAFVHLVSRNDREGLETLGIKVRTVQVPNGIDLSAIPSHVDEGLLYKRYPALQGKRVFLFLGRLDPAHKGLDILLEAFAVARLPEAALVLVGPDFRGGMMRLQEQARRLGLAEQVMFTGPAFGEEKWAYLAGADLFVHPSRWEGFPFSVLEAMAMGKPVLLSTAADPGDIASVGAGITVQPNVDPLAHALKEMGKASQEELKGMGARGRRLVEGRYNWQHIAEKLLVEYERWI